MFLLKFFKKNKTINAKKFKKIIGEGVSVYTYRKIDSTNSEAARKLHKNIKLPALFVTRNQTAGRGRRGRSFYSEGGLYMTLALDAKTDNTVTLTTLVSVAVAEVIDEVFGVSTGIKWVNDIYLEGRKVCGILCENIRNSQSGKPLGIIVGIGVNLGVSAFPDEIKNIAGGLSETKNSAEILCAKITEKILSFIENNTDITEKYKSRSIVLNREITFEQNGVKHTAKAMDIDPSGGLVVAFPDGKIETLSSGEITISF